MENGMNKFCPTCGHPISKYDHEKMETVLDAMNAGKELYRSTDGGWFLTYGLGSVAPYVVKQLVDGGHIRDRYTNLPGQCYTTEKTIDVGATLALRKTGSKELVYVSHPTPQ